MKTQRQKIFKKPLRVNDFICRRCRVQATRDADHICGICKAVGMSVEPTEEDFSWRDLLLSTEFGREIFFWMKARKPIGFVGKTHKSH